eukprot:1161566-Pelagomonas_calceolata.AAC.9
MENLDCWKKGTQIVHNPKGCWVCSRGTSSAGNAHLSQAPSSHIRRAVAAAAAAAASKQAVPAGDCGTRCYLPSLRPLELHRA